jgi:hypothetical protein
MTISKDFEEFFELLNKNEVRYLIVGSYALSVHGKPRYTNDIDIFIRTDDENASKIKRILNDFGFDFSNIAIEDFTKPDQVIQLGYAPFRIDLLTSIDGVSFDEAWENKLTAKYGKQDIFFIGKNDFIKNKMSSGRKKDLDDIQLIK